MWIRLRAYLLGVVGFDTRSLALFRMLLGLVTLAALAERLMVFEAMYTERGAIPLRLVREHYGMKAFDSHHFSLHMLSGAYSFQVGLFLLAAFCAICLTLGWRTRLFTVASWVLYISLRTRNPFYLSAGDVVLGFLLFWGMFLPLAEHFSLDRRRRRENAPPAATFSSVASACFLAQVVVVYLFAAYYKEEGGTTARSCST